MIRFEMTPVMRGIIGFDLFITAWLSLPYAAELFLSVVDAVGVASGMASPMTPFDGFVLLMVNLAGVLGVCWNTLRWQTASLDVARYDAIARLVVAALIVFYVIVRDVTPVILLFALTEVLGSIVEFRLRPAKS